MPWRLTNMGSVGLDWLFDLEICSLPSFHENCSFSVAGFQCPGKGHTPCWALKFNCGVGALGLLRTAPSESRNPSRLWGALQCLIPWGKVPAQLGTSAGHSGSLPAAQGSSSCAPCSIPLPKTWALSTPELIWSNIYSVIKKLFISLSGDEIMVK